MQPSDTRASRARLIILLGALTAFGPLTIDMYLPAFPSLTEQLGTSVSLTQLSLTACLIGIAFGQLIFGTVSDVHGRKKPLIIALILYIITSILCAFAPDIWSLILVRFIQGATGAAGLVIARSCVRDLFSGPDLTKVYSLLILVMGVAPILAPVIGGQLMYFTSWRGIFIALALFGVIMLCVTIFRLKETLPVEKRSSSGFQTTLATFRRLLSHRVFIGFCLVQGLTTASLFTYISGSSFLLQDIYQLTPQQYAILFGLNALGFIIASQITGRLASKVSGETMLIVGFSTMVFAGVSLLIAALAGAGLVVVSIALFIILSSIGIVSPTTMSLAMQTQDKNAGTASALLGLIQFIFAGIAAPIVGLSGMVSAVPMAIILLTCQLGAVTSYIYFVKLSKSSKLKEESKSVS